jgi:hypothetical protein
MGKVHQLCNQEGCTRDGSVECTEPCGPGEEERISHYCPEHCTDNGFCWYCGRFWAGVNAFDFNPAGLCPDCKDEVSCDLAEDFEDEWGPDFFEDYS